MENKIVYNFDLSRKAVQELEEAVACIEIGIIVKLEYELQLLAEGWQGENADEFIKKCSIFQDNLTRIKNNILLQAEQIKKISRHMYLIEQEEKIIITKDSK